MSGLDLAQRACTEVGLSPSELQSLHKHATAVFLHPEADIVLRVSSPGNGTAVRRGVAVARWLAGQGFPATAPADDLPVVDVGGRAVSFWRHYWQHGKQPPPTSSLGRMLRDLHALPAPPVVLPEYQPLAEMGRLLDSGPELPGDDLAWLRQRRGELVAAYRDLQSALGHGPIHGDAYPGNTLWDGDRALLGDWDEVATGPREMDLVNTCQGVRFGRTQRTVGDFVHAYGYEVRAWEGYPVLREIRDLHTLGSYIRRAAAGDQAARTELAHRIKTLTAGDAIAEWHVAG